MRSLCSCQCALVDHSRVLGPKPLGDNRKAAPDGAAETVVGARSRSDLDLLAYLSRPQIVWLQRTRSARRVTTALAIAGAIAAGLGCMNPDEGQHWSLSFCSVRSQPGNERRPQRPKWGLRPSVNIAQYRVAVKGVSASDRAEVQRRLRKSRENALRVQPSRCGGIC